MDLSNNITWIISVSVVVILLTYVWSRRRDPKYPPTPLRSWPIVGNMLQLNPDPRAQFAGFRKQCGDIYSLYLGSTHVVVLNGFDVVKEAIIKQADDFSDRAVTFVDIVSDGVNRGIGSSSGAVWKEHRIFSTTVLRSFGLGKNILAEKIQEETSHFITTYKLQRRTKRYSVCSYYQCLKYYVLYDCW
uniref:Cytochrome P450 n=1 Tax=Arion vulgaris TaxID=1028688 RepID=A0A0B7B687_9EUPU